MAHTYRNDDLKLKIALLSVCVVAASLNAITANIPEMARTFSDVPLYKVELLTTIPSLFQMAGVLGGRYIAHSLGYKLTMILGLLCCGIGGVIPFFIPEFTLIMVTRCLFGIGCGLIMSTILTLILHFFDGRTRSTMIGLNGGISGLGSAFTTFTAGLLAVRGWSTSFSVYFIAFPVILLFALIVPNVRHIEHSSGEEQTGSRPAFRKLIALGLLMFVSCLFATIYVIKASTLITENGFGTAGGGSYAITCISIGSVTAGLTYGRIRTMLDKKALPFYYLICLIGFMAGGLADSLLPVLIGAFLLGFGYLGFMPYIQEEASRTFAAYGETATNLILVFQSLGAFAAPYLGNVFSLISTNLQTQFFMTGGGYAVLTVLSVLPLLGKRRVQVVSASSCYSVAPVSAPCQRLDG